MPLDPKLLEILACPEDRGSLLYFESESSLYNPRLKKRYRIDNDIPVMLIDESEEVGEAEHDRLVAKAQTEGLAASEQTEGLASEQAEGPASDQTDGAS